MSRCPAIHPTLGIQCDRQAQDCNGIDHTCTKENGLAEFWPNESGTTPMHELFADWRNRICPTCQTPLDPQQREPLVYWCAICRKWLHGWTVHRWADG